MFKGSTDYAEGIGLVSGESVTGEMAIGLGPMTIGCLSPTKELLLQPIIGVYIFFRRWQLKTICFYNSSGLDLSRL